MKCLVTGAAGFIGSALCRRLLELGNSVTGIDSFTDFYPRWIKEKNILYIENNRRFSLIDKVYRKSNLRSAFYRVQANKGAAGVDNQTIKQFSYRLVENLAYASESLKSQSYRPRAIKRVYPSRAVGSNVPWGYLRYGIG